MGQKMKHKISTLWFFVEVLLFMNSGYALGVGNYLVFVVSLIIGMVVAFITGKQIIEEAMEEKQNG
jgi:UPF0716 family protein affecting phage T7 exclusion